MEIPSRARFGRPPSIPFIAGVATVVQQFAARLALVGFAAASAQGLFEGQAFEPALKRALGVAAALFALGWICGWLAQQAIRESVESDATRKGPVAP